MVSFLQVSPPKPCISLSSPPIRATCPAHPILFDFINRTTFDDEDRSLSYWLCSFLLSLVTSSILGPNILLNNLSPRSSLPPYVPAWWSIRTYILIFTTFILDNDQRDVHLLYFTIYFLHSSTCLEHYVIIIRRWNCIDAASGIVFSVSGRPVHRLGEFSPNLGTGRPQTESDDTRCCINTIHSPDDEHIILETCRGM